MAAVYCRRETRLEEIPDHTLCEAVQCIFNSFLLFVMIKEKKLKEINVLAQSLSLLSAFLSNKGLL